MNTPSIEIRVEAAHILKQANWSYEWCHGETVTEKYMAEHISEIENGLRDTTVEDLFHKITVELDRNPPDDELTDAEAVAKFVAHDIALFYVKDYSYETVTFKIS